MKICNKFTIFVYICTMFIHFEAKGTMLPPTQEELRMHCYPGSPMINSDLCGGRVYTGGGPNYYPDVNLPYFPNPYYRQYPQYGQNPYLTYPYNPYYRPYQFYQNPHFSQYPNYPYRNPYQNYYGGLGQRPYSYPGSVYYGNQSPYYGQGHNPYPVGPGNFMAR